MQYLNQEYALRTPSACPDFACSSSRFALEIRVQHLPKTQICSLVYSVMEDYIRLDHYPNMTPNLP